MLVKRQEIATFREIIGRPTTVLFAGSSDYS